MLREGAGLKQLSERDAVVEHRDEKAGVLQCRAGDKRGGWAAAPSM